MTILIIKIIHSAIFLILSVCVLFLVYCAIFNRRNKWTLIAFVLVAIEGIVVMVSGWQCPLAELAKSLGAENGSVTQIFLPPFLAGRVFQICTPLASFAIILLGVRILLDRRKARRAGVRGTGTDENGKKPLETEKTEPGAGSGVSGSGKGASR